VGGRGLCLGAEKLKAWKMPENTAASQRQVHAVLARFLEIGFIVTLNYPYLFLSAGQDFP